VQRQADRDPDRHPDRNAYGYPDHTAIRDAQYVTADDNRHVAWHVACDDHFAVDAGGRANRGECRSSRMPGGDRISAGAGWRRFIMWANNRRARCRIPFGAFVGGQNRNDAWRRS
jgi:hypothetical protein